MREAGNLGGVEHDWVKLNATANKPGVVHNHVNKAENIDAKKDSCRQRPSHGREHRQNRQQGLKIIGPSSLIPGHALKAAGRRLTIQRVIYQRFPGLKQRR